jgi:hypothetical protein
MALNWSRERQRQRVARQGTEDALAIIPLFAPLTARRGRPLPLSKAELRAQAAEAVAGYQGAVSRSPAGSAPASSWTVTVRCVCGHMGNATMPRSQPAARFRCSKCGRRQRIMRS